jgi:hypothetical protein
MIKNITTDVTYASVQDAINALPNPLDKDYTIEVSGEGSPIPGFDYKYKTTDGFKLTITSPDGAEVNDSTDSPIEISGSGIQDIDIVGFIIKGFTNGGIYLTNSASARVIDCTIEGGYKCIRTYQHGTITVDGCTLTGTGANEVLTFHSGGNSTIKNSTVQYTGASSVYGVYAYNITGDVLVEDCEIFDCDRNGFYSKDVSGQILLNRTIIHDIVNQGVYCSSGGPNMTMINCLVYDCGGGTKEPVYFGADQVITMINNTIINSHATYAKCVGSYNAVSVVAYNNIFAGLEATQTTGPLVYWKLQAGKTSADIQSENNLFYSAGSAAIINSTVYGGQYSDLAAYKAAETQDQNSVEADPSFNLGTVPDDPDFLIESGSPARNSALDSQSQERDIRNWYREVDTTDIGAYDFEADPDEVPSGGGTTEEPTGVYRLRDYKTYNYLYEAINDNVDLSQDETIVINTEDNVLSVWLASTNPTGFTLRVKASDSLLAAGKKALVRDDGRNGVAFSMEQFTNVIFENIEFDSNGAGMGGLKIGPTKAFNCVFRSCTFRNGTNGVYIYAGEGLEFYDCLFTDCAQYPFHAVSFNNITLDGCEFKYGTVPSGMTKYTSGTPLYLSGGSKVTIRNCISQEETELFDYHCKITDVNGVTIDNSVFKNSQKGALWFTGSQEPYKNTDVTVRDCLFTGNMLDGSRPSPGLMFEGTRNIKLIHNTFVEQPTDDSFIETYQCREFTYVNNYQYLIRHPDSSTQCAGMKIRLDDTGTVDDVIIDHNYYDWKEYSMAWNYILSGSGYNEPGAGDWTNLPNNLEAHSDGEISDTLTAKIDLTTFLPVVASPLIGAADSNYSTRFDNRFFIKDATPNDIGAYETSASQYAESQHTLSFTFQNLIDKAYYDIPTNGYQEIPAYDTIEIILNPDYNRFFNQIIIRSTVSPVSIHSTTTTEILLSGNYLNDFSTPMDLSISGSTSNDGDYTLNSSIGVSYDEVNDRTIIPVNEVLTATTGDGSFAWTNYKKATVGTSLRTQLSERYAQYDLILKSTKPDFTDIVLTYPDAIRIIQMRPSPNFNLSQYMIFPGDSVSFFDLSLGCDQIQWQIGHPDGEITQTFTTEQNRNVENIQYDTVGDYTVTMIGTNSTPYTGNLSRQFVLKVLPAPDRPFIRFNSNREVIHADSSLILRTSTDPDNTGEYTRFKQSGDTFYFSIINSDTGSEVKRFYGQDITINWADDMAGAVGVFDVQLTARNPEGWGSSQVLKRRFLTVYPSLTGKTVHLITCDRDDTWTDPSNSTVYSRCVIDGQNLMSGRKNTQPILAGDVIKLSGYAPELRIYNLPGTAQDHILIIPDTSAGQPFKVGMRKYLGIRTEECTFIDFIGTPNDNDLEYGFEIFTDPEFYDSAPGNKCMDINLFSSDVTICGVYGYDSKFDGISAKTDPDPNDPSTWRNDPTGGFIFKNLHIHHNKFKDTLGEGIYIGYFTAQKIGNALNSESVLTDYYAHIFKDTKIYRNSFINNGFDGMQVGNQGGGGAEVHDNTVIGAAWLNTFGQNAAFSVNYLIGDIYNNQLEGGMVVQIPQGRIRIFNNTIGFTKDQFGNPANIYLDPIYMKQDEDPVPEWNFLTVPAQIVNSNYQYDKSEIFIYQNTMRTPRTPIQILGYWRTYPAYIGIANNAIVVTDAVWDSREDEGVFPQDKILNEMNIGDDSGSTKLIDGNYVVKESNIIDASWSSPDEMMWRIGPGSPLMSGGINLKIAWPTFEFTDADGFNNPDVNGKWPRGAYSFFPINFIYDVSSGAILYRIWSIDQSKWLYGKVLSEGDISPNIAPDGLSDSVDSNSVVILTKS